MLKMMGKKIFTVIRRKKMFISTCVSSGATGLIVNKGKHLNVSSSFVGSLVNKLMPDHEL